MTDKPTHTPLPCPFCGSKALIGQTLDDAWYAMCVVDHCCKLESYWRTEAEALTAWNTRAVNSHHDLIEALRAAREALCNHACHGGKDAPCIRTPDQCAFDCGLAAGDAIQTIDAALKEAGRG